MASNKSSLSIRKWLIPAVVVLVLIVGGIGAYYWYSVSNSNNQNKDDSADGLAGGTSKASPEEQAVAAIVDEYSTSENQDAAALNVAQTKLRSAETNATTVEKKSQYATAAANLYAEAGEIGKALSSALDAENTYHTATTAATVASLYQEKSDYKNAALYYQKAADRSQKTANPRERSAYNDYMGAKKEMDAKL